jgi:cysteinyl-tRNA synthetase
MADIYLYNSLTRKKEKFMPINPPNVGMYTCGPTVYYYLTIGNFRTFVASDILCRTLEYNGYQVKAVMNITDVGHLTGDRDLGEDKLVKAAKREGKTAWDIAKFYTEAFMKDLKELNIRMPDVMPKATEHIKEQIDLVQEIEKKGFTYKISDGIYFDTEEFEKKTGKKYGELSTLDKIMAGARVEENPEKKNQRDFALWKFSYKNGRAFDPAQDNPSARRHMEWESPWGIGYPGWHIECSAMSMKYLGESFDIHAGGEDLRSTHHPNEIVQAEAATGKQFVRYWTHVTFLQVDGKKMSKSLGNVYTLSDIKKKGYSPLALRYLYLTAYYRDSLNFTWPSLESAQNTLNNLKSLVLAAKQQGQRTSLSSEKQQKIDYYRERFTEAVNDDLNTPQALTILWEVLKSNVPSEDKYDLVIAFDEVLGLGLAKVSEKKVSIPKEIKDLLNQREELRKGEKFEEADKLRREILSKGFIVEDTPEGPRVKEQKKRNR